MLTTWIFECIIVCLCKCDVSCRHLVTLYQNHQRNDNSRKATKKSQHLHNDRQQQIQVFTESRVYGKECTDLFRVASVLSADEALTTRVDRELSWKKKLGSVAHTWHHTLDKPCLRCKMPGFATLVWQMCINRMWMHMHEHEPRHAGQWWMKRMSLLFERVRYVTRQSMASMKKKQDYIDVIITYGTISCKTANSIQFAVFENPKFYPQCISSKVSSLTKNALIQNS